MKSNVWKKRTVLFLLFFFLIWTPCVSANAAGPKLSAKKLEIVVGTNAKLKVSHVGKKKVQWRTSNAKIVSVKKLSRTSVRLMAGEKKGSATVTVKVGKKTLKCKVKVVDWYVSATNGTTIGVGDTTTFKFYGVTAKNFSSSNPKVAKVSKKGKISGLKKGSCYILYNVGRIRYKTRIKVVKKVRPDMGIGTHIFANGGSRRYVSSIAKAGKSANLSISDSAAGCYHSIYFYVNGKFVTSGLKVSSSNPSVLSYATTSGDGVVFYSFQDGRTELKVSYGGNTYKFIVTISDRDSLKFQQKRNEIYRSLGINSGMSRQYVCYLLASWICDHTVYDPAVLNNTRDGECGINATYKDYFRYGTVVCSGYADLFMYLCAGLNIPCRQVGNDEMNHRWNQVQIGGKWYNIDSCWMDSATDGSYSFQYFLMSDAAMRTLSEGSHLSDPAFACTDTRFDGCIQEQIAMQTQRNPWASDRPYVQYSFLNPWVTGNWANY